MRSLFEKVYDSKEWGHGSGNGSYANRNILYRSLLENLISINGISSVVDAGCGDWQICRNLCWDNVKYIGIDVVPEIISKNTDLFVRDNIEFRVGDVSEMILPSADLLIVKDTLQHWSNENVRKFLGKIHKFHFCLITNTTNGIEINEDIEDGGWRSLDITKPPFNVNAVALFRYCASRPGEPMDEKTVHLLIHPTV